jgi:hypothetical protein
LFLRLGVWLIITSVATPAIAVDRDSNRRHSLILRPATKHTHADKASAIPSSTNSSTDQQLAGRVPISNTPVTTPWTVGTLTPHRKLTKRPGQDSVSIPSTVQPPPARSVQQPVLPVPPAPVSIAASAATSGVAMTPQARIPGQTTSPLSGLASARSVTAVPTTGAQIPLASAAAAQPVAAMGSGPSSRYGGSRAAMNLLTNKALVNLLQAPPPPLVTPPSPPPSTPPSAPSTPASTPPSTAPPAPTTGSATLSWNLGSESDLGGYKVYVGTSSGTYNYPGSPFTTAFSSAWR